MATYRLGSFRIASVQKKLTPNATHTTAIAMSIGQMSSAYSFAWVRPSGRVIAAATMMACQPQKLNRLRKSDAMRAFSSRCVE